jgi:hypothetical protein
MICDASRSLSIRELLLHVLAAAAIIFGANFAYADTIANTSSIGCSEIGRQKSAGSNPPQTISVPNETGTRLGLVWIDFNGNRKSYGTIEPSSQRLVMTFSGHVWMLADESGNCLAAFIVNGSAETEHDTARSFSRENGIEFLGSSKVSLAAVNRAQYIVKQMLRNLPKVQEGMRNNSFKVEIIGKGQVLSDLPDYAALKGQVTRDGRSFDTGTRGVGGHDKSSIGEENLLCLKQQPYFAEDILVHEFSHSIESYLDAYTVASIETAYKNALTRDLYPKGIYMVRDQGEYWAEGTQSWFGATVRTDVNGGYNRAEKLKAHDPMLAEILEKVYGSTNVDHSPGCPY